MKKFDFVFFDLDGTLVDSGDGVKTAFINALSSFGITAEKKDLDMIMGPPLYNSFREYFGLDDSQAKKAIELYRDFYRTKGIYMDRMYDGIPAVLEALNEAGSVVAVATSKPRVFAGIVLENHNITKYFSRICGSEFDGTRSEKTEVIEYAMRQCGVTSDSRCCMVGDRRYDILGGRQFGMKTVGVLFGYGSEKELADAGADFLAADCRELKRILTGES